MDRIKTIAMYLPQFYETPENNQWWGEGYTDWTAVKNAEKYFIGHNQPREPLNDDYYNLLDKSTMVRQSELAIKYGLDGFCFYHYYFKDGRKILEKPAENLLQWKEIKMPFCFCWANESWVRTWSKIDSNKNIWADKFEIIGNKEKINGLLLEQKYDREKAWKSHFRYLLPFFKDSRYIRFNGAPLFLIYRPHDITCLAEMMYYWKSLAKMEGIEDIYVIGLNTRVKINGLDAVLINGPGMYCWDSHKRGNGIEAEWENGVQNYEYEAVWKNAIEEPSVPECKTYFGGFTDFDDTPRRGKNGCFLKGTSIEIFEKYVYLLMKKNLKRENKYVFINAFNEWGEGMYLEPDKDKGFKYLETLQRVKQKINEEQFEVINSKSTDITMEQDNEKVKIKKEHYYLSILDKWMTLREQKRHLSDYLRQYHYNEIAIYGMGIFGRHLAAELLNDGIKVKYAIDKRENLFYKGIKICKLSSDLETVDAIIVTAIYEYDEIWRKIRKSGITCSVLSLSEILKEYL